MVIKILLTKQIYMAKTHAILPTDIFVEILQDVGLGHHPGHMQP